MVAPWLRRKRRCDNCRHWIKPEPPYMGDGGGYSVILVAGVRI